MLEAFLYQPGLFKKINGEFQDLELVFEDHGVHGKKR